MEVNAYPDLRRNYTLGFVNGVFMAFAYSFADPNTVLPVFVVTLTGSHILAGVVAGMFEAGWYLPQVFVSTMIQHRQRKLPLYRHMAFVRSGAWAAAAILVFLLGGQEPWLLFVVFFICYLGVCLGAGVAGVSFMDVVGKSIPPEKRGGFFGYRRLVGGILGVGAGIIVARVLSERSGIVFPYNYGVLLGLTTLMAVVGLVAFSLIREPIEPLGERRLGKRQQLKSSLGILREDANYRWFYAQRVSSSMAFMALPFFATYAVSELGAEAAQVGVMVSLWMLSGVFSNLLWGTLSDRRGSRVLLAMAPLLLGGALVVALTSDLIPPRPVVIPSVLASLLPGSIARPDLRLLVFMSCFVLNGFALAGRRVGNNVYLLDISPAHRRATYVGLMNTLSSPLSLAPALGGLVASVFSHQVLFFASLIFSMISLALATRLREPRLVPTLETEVPPREV